MRRRRAGVRRWVRGAPCRRGGRGRSCVRMPNGLSAASPAALSCAGSGTEQEACGRLLRLGEFARRPGCLASPGSSSSVKPGCPANPRLQAAKPEPAKPEPAKPEPAAKPVQAEITGLQGSDDEGDFDFDPATQGALLAKKVTNILNPQAREVKVGRGRGLAAFGLVRRHAGVAGGFTTRAHTTARAPTGSAAGQPVRHGAWPGRAE